VSDLTCFMSPKSVAVIGVSKRSGFSWGRGMLHNLVGAGFEGKIYLVNPTGDEIEGLKVYPDLDRIPGQVDLAVITVPVRLVKKAIQDCIQKKVKNAMVVTAGYAETSEGKALQEELTDMAKAAGMRIVGPNVNGIFNLSSKLDVSMVNHAYISDTPIAIISQGGYALNDLIYRGHKRRMGVGKYFPTGNECDVTCTEVLEYFGMDPGIKVIILYIESVRDGTKFLKAAKKAAKDKVVLAVTGGSTIDGAKAAQSHTGAMGGSSQVLKAALKQANIVECPEMELLLHMAHAFHELPPLKGSRIGVVTMGGSWGVMATDALNKKGLAVPELSLSLQHKLHDLGMPYWASARNPVDLGAAGSAMWAGGGGVAAVEQLVLSDEVDAVVVHGFGQTGYAFVGYDPAVRSASAQVEEEMMRQMLGLIPKYEKPILICSYFDETDSETIAKITGQGERVYHNVKDAAAILSCMQTYYYRLAH